MFINGKRMMVVSLGILILAITTLVILKAESQNSPVAVGKQWEYAKISWKESSLAPGIKLVSDIKLPPDYIIQMPNHTILDFSVGWSGPVLHRLAKEYPNLRLKDNLTEGNELIGKFEGMNVEIILLNVFGELGWELVSSGANWHILKRRPM